MHIDGLLFKIEIRAFPQANAAADFPDNANQRSLGLFGSTGTIFMRCLAAAASSVQHHFLGNVAWKHTKRQQKQRNHR